ncbi:MAG: ABC transporter permease [Planctomycetes bacterium]|nr:ABC transporter permease [Planctomycetota bacterium]
MEVAVRMGWVKEFLVPTPTSVFHALFTDGAGSREMWEALLRTAEGSFAGFALSAVLGLIVAVVLTSAGWVQRAFYPYAVFFQTVPIIAIAPLLVIWLGFDLRTVVASAFIVSVFPVIANTLAGLLSVDPALRDLFRLYGAGRVATLFKLKLPSALPSILTGLRIAAGLAVIGAIVGEFITGGGLGGLIGVARREQRVDKVFAILLLSALLGVVMFSLINLAGRLSLRHWHASESAS